MVAIRVTLAAVLILFTAVAAIGECVTAARLISTRAFDPNLISGPVAWTGSVLGVAKSQEEVDTAVWFAAYDESLQTLVPDRQVASDSRALVALEWTGSEFGLFYRTTNQRLHLQRITMMGEPIGGPIAITPGRTVFASDKIEVHWSPVLDAYVVARHSAQGEKGVWVTWVTRDGTHRTDRRLPVFAVAGANLAMDVTEAGVAGVFFTNSASAVSFARVPEEGNIVSLTVAEGDLLEAAALGNLFYLVRSVPAAGNTRELRWLVVDTSFQIVRPDAFLLSGSGADVYPMSLHATADELALAYVDAPSPGDGFDRTYRLRRFTHDGTTLTDTPFAATEAGGAIRSESAFDFVWTGSSYLQAAFRSAPDRLNSHLLRYCPLRAGIESSVPYGRPGQPLVLQAVPDGGVAPYKYEWTFPLEPNVVPRTQNVTRIYDEAGTYTATVKVTDTTGATYTTTTTIEVINVKRRSARH